MFRVLFVSPWTSLIPPLAIRVAPGMWMGHFFLKKLHFYGSTFKFRSGTSLLKPNLSTPWALKMTYFSFLKFQSFRPRGSKELEVCTGQGCSSVTTHPCIPAPIKIYLFPIKRWPILIPILPNNYIYTKFPLWHYSKIQRCTWVRSEVKSWWFKGVLLGGPLNFFSPDGYVRCKALKRGSKILFFCESKV